MHSRKGDFRKGNYPNELTAPVTHEVRAAVDAEVDRQGTSMAVLLRALVDRTIDNDDWPVVAELAGQRYWNAVRRDFAFADETVKITVPAKHTEIYVYVQNTTFRDDALRFCAYRLIKRPIERSEVGCFLARRADTPPAVRIFSEIESSLEELRGELGDDLERWITAERPRIGFRITINFPLLDDDESEEFRAAVMWMREHLDRLVSTLHPRLQRMIATA